MDIDPTLIALNKMYEAFYVCSGKSNRMFDAMDAAAKAIRAHPDLEKLKASGQYMTIPEMLDMPDIKKNP